jgi:DNA-binding Lrp family transcriptional regulator
VGSESKICSELKEIPEVKEAHSVYGVYDIIACIDAKTEQKIKDIINIKIRQRDKVSNTITMFVL